MQLELMLFGHYQLTVDGVPVKFATEHTRALLAFLTIEARPHERVSLAALLWPEQPEAAARQNLRQTLVYLKQALGKHVEPGRLLEITAKTIRFHPEGMTIDARQFGALWAACSTHAHPTLAGCSECAERLQRAAELYKGEFLKGLFIKNSAPFDEWAIYVREQFHRQAVEVLHALSLCMEANGDHEQMRHFAARQLALEPWREEAHRQVMRALALSGQGTAALAHYAVCRRVLNDELGAEPSPATIALYAAIKQGKLSGATTNQLHPVTLSRSQQDSPTFPNNLAGNLSQMIGRSEELEALRRAVMEPRQRLVTLVGMGGVGKTRLAQALLEQFAAAPPPQLVHGAWFVPLAGIAADLAHVRQALAEAILNTLNVTTSGQEEPQPYLLQYLSERTMVLVLDNFEHLLADENIGSEALAFLDALLTRAPGVTVIVTSHMPLQTGDERVIRLEGLAIPDVKSTNGFSFDSIRLFEQASQHISPNFIVDDRNLAEIIEICRLVDGAPLGIRLVASLTPHFAGSEIVEAIRGNLALLTSTHRELDVRHRQMTAVFEYSWQLLSTREQRVLAQLAIFRGRFSRAVAQSITEATLPDLIKLVDKALVRQPVHGLYEVHSLLRQFSLEKLTTLDDALAKVLQMRYVNYYLGWIAERAPELRQRNTQAVVGQIRQEGENCRHAWQMALELGWFELLTSALKGLRQYWKVTGRYQEGEALVNAALTVVAMPVARSMAEPHHATLLIHLWYAHAECLYGQNLYRRALEAVETAMALAMAAQDQPAYAYGLVMRAETLSWQGRHVAAKPFADQAYTLAQQLGMWDVEARALITQAWYRDSLAKRLEPVAQALRIAQEHGDFLLELHCMENLAGSCENEGYYGHALPYRAQALRLAHELCDSYQIGEAEYLYGLIHAHLGIYQTAIEHFDRALALAHEHSYLWLERRCLNRLAASNHALGKLDEAYAFSARVQIHGETERPPFFDFVYAQILTAQGKWAEASLIHQQRLKHKRTLHGVTLTRLLPELAALARITLRHGDRKQALAYVEEALGILNQHPHFSTSDLYFDRFAIDSACYQVLQAANDPRARHILEASYGQLMALADEIQNPSLRRAYLENVVANHTLVAAWQAMHARVQGPGAPRPRLDGGAKPVDRTVLHNLPVALTPLVGRATECAEILNRLQDPTVRLLTLVGPGGMGKTRLALAVAHKILNVGDEISDWRRAPSNPAANIHYSEFCDGLFFVSLASISTADALAPTIAAAMDLQAHDGDLLQALRQHLPDKKILLILDNVENLLPATPSNMQDAQGQTVVDVVIDLLHTAPHLQIVATSRERLNLRSEHLFFVPPLAAAQTETLAEAAASGAVQLFVASARRVDSHFTLTEQSLPAVLQICRLVQGMPLGLEMASARVDQLSLTEIAREIDKSIDFLTVAWRDTPERQRSIRAVLDWSWRRLDEAEQQVMRRLAVFHGGFTNTAAGIVAGASERSLAALVRKSLLRRIHTTTEVNLATNAPQHEAGHSRYELHALLRQFAQEQLAANPAEAVDTASRHSAYYLQFVADRERRIARNEPHIARAEIHAELDNIRQAWAQAVRLGNHRASHESAYSLWQFFLLAGLFAEGIQTFRLAADGLQRAEGGVPASAHTSHEQQSILCKLRAIEAYMLVTQGRHDEAPTVAQAAITMAAADPDVPQFSEGEALSLLAWGYALYYQGQFSHAETHCERALICAKRVQHEHAPNEWLFEIEVLAQLLLGAVARNLGDYRSARDRFGECLQCCRGLGKLREEAHAHINLGHTALQMRALPEARRAYEQSLSLSRTLGYRWGEGVSRYELGLVLRLQGEYSAALKLWEQALVIVREINERLRQIYILTDFVELYSLIGDADRAGAWERTLLEASQTIKSPDGDRATLLASAKLAISRGHTEQALDYAYKAWQVVEQSDSRSYKADVLLLMGHAQRGLGLFDAATDSYAKALRLYQITELPSIAAEAQAGLAQIALERGDRAQAHTLAESMLAVLDTQPHVGLDEPFLVYLTCFRALQANRNPHSADVLARANAHLQRYARAIPDDDLRRTYLDNGERRALVDAYAQAQREPHNGHGACTPICAEPVVYVE